MKLKYIGANIGCSYLTSNKIYEATDEGEKGYRVIDDSGEDYLYSKENPAEYVEGKVGKWEVVEK